MGGGERLAGEAFVQLRTDSPSRLWSVISIV